MKNPLLSYLYKRHNAGYERPNLIHGLHRKVVQSPYITEKMFGHKILPQFMGMGFFDLTTLLLKSELKRKVTRQGKTRLLEIGVGRFALLSGYLSRLVPGPVVACDFEALAMEGTRAHIAANNLNVQTHQSDVLESAPPGAYDLIWWNLPYYQDPQPILSKLFRDAPDFLAAEGELILGFNSWPLPEEKVLAHLALFPALRLIKSRSYWWNRHKLLIIGHAEITT